MKYCHHCGALLMESTASFCSECGKALKSRAEEASERPGAEEVRTPPQTEKKPPVERTRPPEKRPVNTGGTKKGGKPRQPAPPPAQKQPKRSKPPESRKPAFKPANSSRPIEQSAPRKKPPAKKKKPQNRQKKEHEMDFVPRPDPQDENYDGYYDDVRPDDSGHAKERLDPELIKRIALIAAGALVLIIFSIFIMYAL